MGRIVCLALVSLTGGERSRSFNQLTPARGLPHSFPAARLGLRRSNTWRLNNEQENVPAEQPSSRQGARIPPSHAHPRRPRHPRCTSSQGPHRALRVSTPVLAHANRITSGSDYKAVVRRGVRVVGPHTVAYLRRTTEPTPVRFGFIVAKNVGGAVVRNRVRRRMKAASFDLLPGVPDGTEVVFRALPASVDASWPDLLAELSTALVKGQRGR
jgi:ribonuclease P protein component